VDEADHRPGVDRSARDWGASVIIVGIKTRLIAEALSLGLPLSWARVSGALVSPTDPDAVLATVKQGNLSKTLRVILQGEALLNDGVGMVVFAVLLKLATGNMEGIPARGRRRSGD
jgi:CPA1 family monovalent cation:H+ antiporter